MEKFLIGIDLGGTFIKTHLFSCNGDSIGNIELKTPAESIDSTIKTIVKSVNIIIDKFLPDNSLNNILSIGVGVPGTIDSTCKKIVFAPNLGWNNVNFVEKLEKELNIPTLIENDANLAAIGEYWQGNAKNVDNFISITIGTGIGGGIFVNGNLLTGVNHNGAEIGHMIINSNGLKCNCGNLGCWEQYASTSALVKRVYNYISNDKNRKHLNTYSILLDLIKDNLKNLNGKFIVEAAKLGDTLSNSEIKIMQSNLAIGISNLIFIFNPQLILLNGGITRQGEWFISPIREHIYKMSPQTSLDGFKILSGKLGNMAGAYGAAFMGLKENNI